MTCGVIFTLLIFSHNVLDFIINLFGYFIDRRLVCFLWSKTEPFKYEIGNQPLTYHFLILKKYCHADRLAMTAGLNHKAGASPNACFASLTSPYSQLGYYHNEYFRVKLERREIKFPEL